MTFPPDFIDPMAKMVTAHFAAESIAGLSPARRAVVQAGGCAGLWPLVLAPYFDQVYTYEPEPVNFECLCANVGSTPNVAAYPYALGATNQRVGLTRPKAGAGLWQVSGAGTIPMRPLDELIAGPIDALVLDVEGAEVPALHGAERLITTYRPLLWFEFLHHTAAIEAFLAAHGYTPPAHGRDRDKYSIHVSRMH